MGQKQYWQGVALKFYLPLSILILSSKQYFFKDFFSSRERSSIPLEKKSSREEFDSDLYFESLLYDCGAEIKSGIMTFNCEQSFNMTRFFTQSVEDCPNCGKMAPYSKSDYYILKKVRGRE